MIDMLQAFEVCNAVAKRVVPNNPDVASDLAMAAFDKFTSVERYQNSITNLRAFAWKEICFAYKRHLKAQSIFLTESSYEGEKFEGLFPARIATQENHVEARQWAPRVCELPEPSRSALLILADGGSVKDVMDDLKMSPKSALYAISEGRRLLAGQ